MPDKNFSLDCKIVEVHEKYKVTIPMTGLTGDISFCTVTNLGLMWIGRLEMYTVYAFTQEGAVMAMSDLPNAVAAKEDWYKSIEVLSV